MLVIVFYQNLNVQDSANNCNLDYWRFLNLRNKRTIVNSVHVKNERPQYGCNLKLNKFENKYKYFWNQMNEFISNVYFLANTVILWRHNDKTLFGLFFSVSMFASSILLLWIICFILPLTSDYCRATLYAVNIS